MAMHSFGRSSMTVWNRDPDRPRPLIEHDPQLRSHRTRRPSYKLREGGSPAWKPRRGPLRRHRSRGMPRVEVVVPTLRQVDARLQAQGGARARASPVRVHRDDSQERRTSASPRVKAEEGDAQMCFLLQVSILSALHPCTHSPRICVYV